MTTLAKVEANRRNAALSTGPRTDAGKAQVARNATRHGIFSNVPVIPGECAATWEAHRAGVVAALKPVGWLELNLAERAALVLWRLQRLARYEAESVAAAMQAAEVPALPLPDDAVPPLFPKPPQKTREHQLWDIREDLRKARRELAEVVPARDYFACDAEPQDNTLPLAVAETILEAALGRAQTAENMRTDPPRCDSQAFLKKLDLGGAGGGVVVWTLDLIRRGLAVYAGFACEPVEEFVAGVRIDVEERAEEVARTVRRLEREEAAVVRLLESWIDHKRAAKIMPSDGGEERIAKYERHLHTLLTSTLHELERLQARRGGEQVPPPVVADVNITLDSSAT